MSEPCSEDEGILREWAPLSGLLCEIPLTVRRGIFLENVSLTCVDAVPEYIAVGTNIGVVYWYKRESHSIQRLRPEKSGYSITCVKIVSSVDYMVAVGDKGGNVTVFRIPKPTPDWLPDSFKQNTNTQVERYTVGGLHTASVTALEWSMNGQKLFSGDLLGLVVYTEIDFYMNLSKACEVLNEKYCIVQLSFNHHCQVLLVATEYRCILAFQKEAWRVVQVGQKERRSLCHLGATFVPKPTTPQDPLVYSARAGLRFWQADKEGVVHKTIIFKDAVKKPHPAIRPLRPRPADIPLNDGDFGPLLLWKNNLLVTHDTSSLLILDPEKTSVVASLSGLTNLHSVAVSQDEIFIIEGSRNIMRLSYIPDDSVGYKDNKDPQTTFLELKVAPVADSLVDLTVKLKETAAKLVSSQPSNAVNGMLGEQEIVSTAAEAMELDLPPILPLESTAIEELTIQIDPRIQIFDQIGKQSFDEIIVCPEKKVMKKQKHPTKNKNSQPDSPATQSNAEITNSCREQDDPPVNLDTLSDSTKLPQNKLGLDLIPCSNAIPSDILPDLRSPDTILKDLRDKELLVAKALNLEVLLNCDEVTVNKVEEKPDMSNPIEEMRSPEVRTTEDVNENCLIPLTEDIIDKKVKDIELSSRSTSLQHTNSFEVSVHPLAQDYIFKTDNISEQSRGWDKVACPVTPLNLTVADDYVCMGGPSMSVYCSKLDQNSVSWQKLSYRANQLSLSPSAELVWKLDFGVANAMTDDIPGPYGTRWEIAARGVESMSLGVSVAWYISSGRVHLQTELSRNKPFRDSVVVPCPLLVTKICCMDKNVIVLTVDQTVMWRFGITSECLEGTHWKLMSVPASMSVGDVVLGPNQTVCILDRNNKLFISNNFKEDRCDWLHVCINDYVFENAPLCQVAASPRSFWITNKVSQFVLTNSSVIVGEQWTPVSLSVNMKWRQFSAEGVFEDKGSLWLISSAAELFHLLPNTDVIKPIALPCHGEDIVMLSAAPHSLWLLTHLGHIYIRQGLGDNCPEGTKWRQLNLEQINSEVTLRHISCGADVVWACDTKGDVYMVVGSPYDIATDIFSPAWVPVDGKPQRGNVFTKVFVSSETYMVWAVDNKNNVYVREGIFHDFQLGTDWVLVSGIQATSLSVSGSAVWALSPDGSVFRRHGISQTNYIGNYWLQITGGLSVLSASVNDGLWGISDSSATLAMYSSKKIYLNNEQETEECVVVDKYEDWEVV